METTGFAPTLAKHHGWWSRTDPAPLHPSPAPRCLLPCSDQYRMVVGQEEGEVLRRYQESWHPEQSDFYFIFSNVIFPSSFEVFFAARAADGLETGSELGAGGTHPCSPRESFEAKNIVNRKNSLTDKEATLDL